MVKILLHGCNGRMGRMITSIVEEDPHAEIVAGVDINMSVDNSYPVYRTLSEVKETAEVIVDFGNASAVDTLLEYCLAKHIGVVLCTTGLSDEQLAKVEEVSKEVPVLKSANMSLGINLIMKILQENAAVLEEAGFDIEIVERHHRNKVDAPSGTALALADAVNEGCTKDYEYVFDRSTRRMKRPDEEIGISAVRGGSIVGDHDVIFAGQDEVITFSHTAYSRALFGKGAVQAAKFLKDCKPGYYSMADVIKA